jgi:hypothetical protein
MMAFFCPVNDRIHLPAVNSQEGYISRATFQICDKPKFSSPDEVTLALEKLAELVRLNRTDPEAYEKELDRMYPGSKTRDLPPQP